MRKIAVVTGSRAEYGLLYWIIKGIQEEPGLELQLIVTGAHLSREFGLTFKEIESDGFPIAARFRMLVASDTEAAIATSMGIGIIGFAKAYQRLKPDILVALGDRFEILSAVAAAAPFRIPVAHIHGGESTEGAMDELFRYAITKMSHIHFTATQRYRQRVIQTGELKKFVFCFGAPGLDSVRRLNLLNKEELYLKLRIPMDRKIGVVTYHPVTLENNTARLQMSEIFKAISGFPDIFWVFTYPNADPHGRNIIKKIKEFVKRFPDKSAAFASLGHLKYLSLLKNAALMLGNSSSGLIEAPSFELPAVNIGERQKGRIRAKNVIDVAQAKRETIIPAVKKAASFGFRASLRGMKNPYGGGNASKKIVEKLKIIRLGECVIKKKFIDLVYK